MPVISWWCLYWNLVSCGLRSFELSPWPVGDSAAVSCVLQLKYVRFCTTFCGGRVSAGRWGSVICYVYHGYSGMSWYAGWHGDRVYARLFRCTPAAVYGGQDWGSACFCITVYSSVLPLRSCGTARACWNWATDLIAEFAPAMSS
jgi:hypothetical protein